MLIFLFKRYAGLQCLLIYLLLAAILIECQPKNILDEDDEAADQPVEVKIVDEGFSYSEFIEDDLTASRDTSFGHLTGDVQNWGAIIQNYILQVST